MVYNDGTNLNHTSKYIVDGNGGTPYRTIQSALDAANAAGVEATVYIRPAGNYTEDLTFYSDIDVVGASAGATTGLAGLVNIIGNHTAPLTGSFSVKNVYFLLAGAGDIFPSIAAGSTNITLDSCKFDIFNGFIFNLPNWTGTLRIQNCIDDSTANGIVTNAASADIILFNNVILGAGIQSLDISGSCILIAYNTVFACGIIVGGTATFSATGGCVFLERIIFEPGTSGSITDAIMDLGGGQALIVNSTGISLSYVTINSTNALPIGGSGSVNFGSVTFLENSTIASTVTVVDDHTLDTSVHGWNGSALETAAVTVTSDGVTITLSVQQAGGGDLTLVTSRGFFNWDTTPAATIALTAGTDVAPQQNFIYWLESTRTLTVSTVSFPATEHVPIATVLCQSAASLQTDGAYKVHAWTDHLTQATGQGHVADLNSWIRNQNATWRSGAAPTLTITPQGAAPDDVIFTSTAGVVLQLHDHTFPAFAGTPDIYTVNDFTTPYNVVTDLNALLTDSTNVSMVGRYFSLVIWGVVSEATGDCKLMVNLPSGSYNTQAGLIADDSKFASFEIPAEFTGTGFLIAQLQLRHQVAAGGTWTEIDTIDLRGQFPNVAAGGSVAVSTEFVDNTFRILDNADPTKEIAFQASAITTGTTRTVTMADRDLDLDTPTFTSVSFGDEVLANYDEGTWTPDLQFGGAKVGITYATNVGSYTRIGNRVFIQCQIALTSKGTSVGVATIEGLPITSHATEVTTAPGGEWSFINLGGLMISLQIVTGGTTIGVNESLDNGAIVNLTDAAFANNTQLLFTLTYRV